MPPNMIAAAVIDAMKLAVVEPMRLSWRIVAPGHATGTRKSSTTGSGDDFAKSSERVDEHGSMVDWQESAMHDFARLYVRSYHEPQQVEVFVLGDISMSMLFGTELKSKLHIVLELLASVGYSAIDHGDRFGYALFGNESWILSSSNSSTSKAVLEDVLEQAAHRLDSLGSGSKPAFRRAAALTAVRGRIASFRRSWKDCRQFLRALSGNSLVNVQTAFQSGSSLSEALAALPGRKSLVYIVSDFRVLTAADIKSLSDAGGRHDVRCFIVTDKRERELPAGNGFYRLTDIATGAETSIWLSGTSRAQYAANFRKHLTNITALLARAGCQWVVVNTDDSERALTQKIIALFDDAGSLKAAGEGVQL